MRFGVNTASSNDVHYKTLKLHKTAGFWLPSLTLANIFFHNSA